jgi:hypothetical protein
VVTIAQVVGQVQFSTGGMEVVLDIILAIHDNKPQVQTGNLLVGSELSLFRVEPEIKVTKIHVAPVGIWFRDVALDQYQSLVEVVH